MTARRTLSATPAEAPVDEGVGVRLLQISYDRLRMNLLLTAASVCVGTAVIWHYLPQRELGIWCANLLLMVGIGLAIDVGYRRTKPQRTELGFWKVALRLHIWHSGAAWGLGPILMMGQVSDGMAMLLVVIVLTNCAVVVNSVAEQRGAMFGFVTLTLLPPAAFAWFQGSDILHAAAFVLLLGHAAFILTGAKTNQMLRTMFESQTSLRSVLDNSLDAILGVDDRGRITDWNGRAEAIFGWSRDEILGQQIDETIIPAQHREGHRRGMARFLEEGGLGMMRRRIELAALRRDGSEFPIELVISPGRIRRTWRFTCFITDISDRKAAAESLLVLSRAIEQSPASIIITDPQGTIRYVNPRFESVTGYARTEVLGHNPRLLSSGDKSPDEYRAMWDVLKSGRTWQGEFHNRRKDGTLFWELASISPVVNDKGVLTHYVAVKEDISERKATELALIEARETAERASRAKSDFLSSMSHELRTPMNAILGFAQILELDERLDGGQREFVEEILKGGTHLLSLINDVLELSRIESGKVHLTIESLDLAALAEECRTLIQPLADNRNLRLQVDLPPSLTVQGDRVRLKQSLLNLLSNAVKYNRDGGEIRLEACPAAGARLRIVVSDTGRGIPPERMSELFQPFSRLGAEQGTIEGTGIGLNITRQLVGMMNGKVGAESTPDKGSRFWIELPVGELHADGRETCPSPLPAKASWPGHESDCGVLCIDDNPVNLKLITRMLERHRPLRLRTATSAASGIELARSEAPDLILLDINMPGLDGFGALELLRKDADLYSIPVIAITANAMPKDVERGLAAGFAAYLTKPLDHARLAAEVDRFLGPQETATP